MIEYDKYIFYWIKFYSSTSSQDYDLNNLDNDEYKLPNGLQNSILKRSTAKNSDQVGKITVTVTIFCLTMAGRMSLKSSERGTQNWRF